MPAREVQISVRVDDTGSDGAFKRLTARFNELGDVSDKAIRDIGKSLSGQLATAYKSGGEREYLETIRRLAPEFRALQEQVKAGSFSIEDYNRRLQFLSAFTKDAIEKSEQLGAAFRKNDEDAQNTRTTIKEMLGEFGGNLAARAVAQLIDYFKQLGQEATQTALEVEQAVANISTLKNIDISKTSQQLFELSTRVPQSAQQLGEGLYNIFSSVEATQSQAVALLEQFAKGATAARTDTETFGTAVLGVINSYKLGLSDAAHISDVFFNTVALGVVNGQELASNLGIVTQSAKNAGVSIDELGGLIAGVTKEGGPAAQNINNLNNLLLKFPTTEVIEGLKKMNIEMTDANGNFRPILDVLTDLKAKLDQLSPVARTLKLKELFPDIQAQTGLNTILSQLDFVKNATLENARAVGVSEEAYRKMSGTASAQLQILHNSVIAFLSALAQWITQSKTLGTVLGWLGSLFQTMANHTGTVLLLVAALGGLIIAFKAVSVAAAISAIVTYIQGLSGLIGVVGNVIRAMFGLQTAFATTGAAATALTGGWIALIGITAAVVAAIYSYATAAEDVKTADEQRISNLTKLVDVTNEDIKFLKDQTVSINDSANARDRYDSILRSISLTNQLTIKDLGDEQQKRQELVKILEKENAVRQEQIRTQAVIAAVAATAKLEQALEAEKQLTQLDESRKKIQQMIESDNPYDALEQESIVTNVDSLKMLETEMGNVSDKSKEARDVLDSQTQILASLAMHANQTGLEFLQFNGILTTNKGAQESLAEKIDQTIHFIQNQRNETNKTTGAINDQTDAVFNLRNELNKLTKFNQEEVDRSVYDIVKLTKTKAEAEALARKTMENSPDFRQKIQDNRDATERMKAVQEIYSPSEKSSSNRIKAAKKELSELKQQIESAMANPQVKAFFSALSTIEGGGRFTVVGGNKANINDPRHPGQYGMGMNGQAGWSTAAGFWQETQSNWKRLTPILNLNDFRDVNQQLKVALYLFQEAAGKKGINGIAELVKGNFEKAAKAGTQPWAASPFSTLPGGKRKDFLSLVNQNLGSGNTLVDGNAEVTNAERIVELRQQIANLQANGLTDAKLQQDIQLANFELELRETSEILKLRQKLNYEITEPLPQSQEDRKEALRTLQEFDRRKETINQTIRDITDKLQKQNISGSFAFVSPINPEEAKQQAEQFDLVSKSLDSFTQMGETARQQIAELSSEFDEGLSPLQKFDLQVKMLRESGKLTADQFDILNLIIPQTREELEKAGTMELGKKLRLNAKAVTTSLTEMVTNFRQQITELNQSEDVKPFGGFLQQIEQLKELDLPTDSFAEMRDAISPSGIDVEKLAGIARAWLEISAAIGGTDPAKIDEIVDKIKQTAQAFNQLTDEQRKAKNAEDYKNLNESLDDEYAQLIRNGRELTTYEQTLRDLNTTYKNLSDSEKANLLLKAEQIDAYRQSQEVFNKTTDYIEDKLHTIRESGFKGLFKSLLQDLEDFLIKATAKMLASKFLQLLQGKGLNVSTSTSGGNIFQRILGGTLGGSNSNAVNLGNAGQIFSGSQGNGVYNFSGGAESFTANGINPVSIAKQVLGGAGNAHEALHTISGGSGNIFASLGKYLPFAGIGVGLLTSLFGGSKNRKLDKNENLPKLQQGFVDSIKDFNQLISDVRNVNSNTDLEDALKKATEIRTGIANGLNVSFASKKYRRIAQNEIAQQIALIDKHPGGLMEQLQAAVMEARGRREFQNKFVATFADGVYMDSGFASQYADFKRYNGLLPGRYTGRDYIKALIGDGEIVANAAQQERMRRAAGFDVIAHAGLPNYPTKPTENPKPMASGGYVGTAQTSGNPSSSSSAATGNFNIILKGVIALPDMEGYLQTPDGETRIVNIIADHIDDNPPNRNDGIPRKLEKVRNK